MRGLAIFALIFGLCSGVYVAIREGPSTFFHPLRKRSLPPELGRYPRGWRWFAREDRAITYLWRSTFFACVICLMGLGVWWVAAQI